jgi:uncharacterized membrane protein YphA (DoxX/SURF4 family)
MKYLGRIFRIIVGLVFIFSGFVKSVDPYGTAYKITEYLNVFGFSSLIERIDALPIIMSIVLCSLEFVVGVLLVMGIYKKPITWIVSLMMIFFTILTLIDALTNKVTDCGCFGDAVKLTNWETFFKNIILDIMLVLAIVFDKIKEPKLKDNTRRVLLVIVVLIILIFTSINAIYEPMIDFRPWKEGNKMVPMQDEQTAPISYATYKNNITQEEKEFGMEDLMQAYQDDPNFATNWTFISSRIINTNTIAADGFSMMGIIDNKDEAFEILSHEGTLFIFTLVDLSKPSEKAIAKISEFEKQASNKGYASALITASPINKWKEFTDKHNWTSIMMYSTDDKAIQTMMRSNPGVVMIENGVVKKKWSWRCLPKFEKLNIAQE